MIPTINDVVECGNRCESSDLLDYLASWGWLPVLGLIGAFVIIKLGDR